MAFPVKATSEQLISAYKEHNNIWKVAELFGMCGQSVWERLQKIGCINQMNVLIDEEKNQIRIFYENGFEVGDGKLAAFAKKIKRTVPFISRYARSIFLSNINRKLCDDRIEQQKKVVSESFKENGHPKGMLGKKKSPESIERQIVGRRKYLDSLTPMQKKLIAEKAVITRRQNGTDKGTRGSWKSDWRTIGGKNKFFRSRWEANYARYLESQKESGEIKEWLHEPETFWFLEIKRGSRSYLPDFKVIRNDDSFFWVEVKGYMCPRSKTKIKRFRKYFPKETLLVVDKEWFKKHSQSLSRKIKGWEHGRDY